MAQQTYVEEPAQAESDGSRESLSAGWALWDRWTLLVLAAIFLLRYGQDFFIPVVLAILIAYALDPIVTILHRLRVPQSVAAVIVLLGLLATVSFGAYQLRHQAMAAVNDIPEAAQKLRERIRSARLSGGGTIGDIREAATEIERTAAEATVGQAPSRGVARVQVEERFSIMDYLWSGSLGAFGLVGQGFLVMFLVFFILSSGDLFKRKIVRLVGTRFSEKRVTLEALNEIQVQVGRFLLTLAITAVLVGICTTLALWFFGMKEPAVWGLFAGVANSIPYFGPLIVTAGLALVAFLQFDSLLIAFEVAGVALFITSLEGLLLTPALMGKAARINGVAMFISLLFWSWLWGVIGMIVAVPITMVIKVVSDRIASLQPLGELLDER
jgi:predicted PurR-regulated permease PerM